MLAARNFTAARQCLRSVRVAPSFAPIVQFRGYAAAADDAVAKFKGQKGPDVRRLPS
jgi:isocitrate dehydrogenase (NAD+)